MNTADDIDALLSRSRAALARAARNGYRVSRFTREQAAEAAGPERAQEIRSGYPEGARLYVASGPGAVGLR